MRYLYRRFEGDVLRPVVCLESSRWERIRLSAVRRLRKQRKLRAADILTRAPLELWRAVDPAGNPCEMLLCVGNPRTHAGVAELYEASATTCEEIAHAVMEASPFWVRAVALRPRYMRKSREAPNVEAIRIPSRDEEIGVHSDQAHEAQDSTEVIAPADLSRGAHHYHVATPAKQLGDDGLLSASTVEALPEHFDVALSFAGPERDLAEAIAVALRAHGVSVFYDRFYSEHLWGEELTAVLDDIYRKRSRFCVMIVSTNYAERVWTNHERKSALARAVHERGKSFILPLQIDDTELPGLSPSIGYLSLRDHQLEDVVGILLRKLATAPTGG